MKKFNQLKDIYNSGKPFVIYKSMKGFDLYTEFSKKIILNNKNIYKFLNRKNNNKKLKNTDLLMMLKNEKAFNNLL